MNWLVLTILALTSRAVYSLGTRMLSRDVKASPVTQSFLLTGTSGLLSLLVTPFIEGINFDGIGGEITPAILLVVASVFGNIIYFKGQKHLDAGITQIAFSSILIWGAILSVLFLGSVFSILQILGIVLMLFAILLVQMKEGRIKLEMNINALYIVISAALFSIFQVASADISSSISTGAYLMFSYFGVAIIIFLFYSKNIIGDFKKLTKNIKQTYSKTLFASFTSMLYFVFSFVAYRTAPDRGVVVVLLTAQVVLSVIFGIIFLRERENIKRKLLAGVLAFMAGVLIKS